MKHSGEKKDENSIADPRENIKQFDILGIAVQRGGEKKKKKRGRKLFKEIIARLLKPTQRSEGHYWFKCLLWFMHRRGPTMLTSSGTWISTDGSKQCSPTKCNCLLFLLFPGRDHHDSFD